VVINLPLDDHAAMYVTASRLGHPPCVGVLRRFREPVSDEALAAYAAQLAANPKGFGRRVAAARIPGARARWRPADCLPFVRVEREPLATPELAAVLDEEVSAQPDPSRDAGWRLTALTDHEGGSVVLTWLHHAYGDGRAILEHGFAPLPDDHVPLSHSPVRAVHELGDIVMRVREGVAGSARLGREAALGGWRIPHSDLARLGPALAALRARDSGVGTRSQRRIVALARMDIRTWKRAAAARGGNGNTLLIAVLANLLRLARGSRGEPHKRPLRLLLPVDTRRGWSAAMATNAAAATIVNLPGGAPSYGSLEDTRAAIHDALRMTPATAHARRPRPAGIIDAMQLLPDAITHRVASRVQAHADGVVSNVGSIPAHVAQLGPHTAQEVFLLAGPMRTDITVCMGRDRTDATLGVVADPARLGPVGGLRERVAEELAAWGVDADMR
jgi:diacylglycerol O-acyltransferase